MLRIIFKNIWNRRRRNVWLFIELILVTALSWYIFDPALVSFADSALPLGYDADRLVSVTVSSYPEDSHDYRADAASAEAQQSAFQSMEDALRVLPQIESITVNDVDTGLGYSSISIDQLKALTPGDSLAKMTYTTLFYPGTRFFETMGIKTLPGSPSPQELSQMEFTVRNGCIITRDLAEMYWPGENACGKYFRRVDENGDTVNMRKVYGVVENVRYSSCTRTNSLYFTIWSPLEFPIASFQFVLRVKPGVDTHDFATSIINDTRHFNAGNYYIKSVTPYDDIIVDTENTFGVRSERRRNVIVGLFFLINLIIGTVGSFFLQTERRIGEIGVHRCYGALPRHIVAMIVGEALIMASLAFVAGNLLYLQYALKKGLDSGLGNNHIFNLIDCWQSDFWPHFGVVSLFIFAVIILSSFVGTIIPALRASRVNPVDALRDE